MKSKVLQVSGKGFSELGERLRELELTRGFVRESTADNGDLRNPLVATRRTALLDEPGLMGVRLFVSCGGF